MAFGFMLFLPRDASAERGNATVSRPSVCLSVRPNMGDLVQREHPQN